jgi:hypothetical protein
MEHLRRPVDGIFLRAPPKFFISVTYGLSSTKILPFACMCSEIGHSPPTEAVNLRAVPHSVRSLHNALFATRN